MDAELLRLAQQRGTDAEYRIWVQRQPSCISGRFSEYLESGEGRSIAAHVRRVGNGSGIGHKPPYSAVPITQDEHLRQHQHGESYFHPTAWWEAQAEAFLRCWVRQSA